METELHEAAYKPPMDKPNKILEIFNDFFGENRVDMQNISPAQDRFCIIVHFPFTRVTNEYDKYVDIPHLYAKVNFYADGRGDGHFSINRSEYSVAHLRADYMHSHCPGTNLFNTREFLQPCLGHGPIRNTLASLAIEYDEAMWQLLCLELDKYMRTESIAGIPYRRLESIHDTMGDTYTIGYNLPPSNTPTLSLLIAGSFRDFIRYFLLSKKLKYNFIDGSWGIAMSFEEFIITVSNSFIEWYNKKFNEGVLSVKYSELLANVILEKCIINNNKIEYLPDRRGGQFSDYFRYEGRPVCTFKGREIKFHVVDDISTTPSNEVVLLNRTIVHNIVRAILTLINYKYGREEYREEDEPCTPTVFI